MRRLLLLLSLFIAASGFGKTAVFQDEAMRHIVSSVVDQTFQMEYLRAMETTKQCEAALPDHPIAPLMRAGAYYCRMLDHEDLLDAPEFEREYALAWERAERLKSRGEIAEGDLYLGMLLGLRAMHHQRLGEWWPAVKYGMKAVGYLNDCVKRDPSYDDAYLGIGCYKYWRSRATDFINWLPFIPDQKEAGIALMRRSMKSGLFGREIARSTLAWTLIDHKRPSEAVTLSLEGLHAYPESRFFLWTLADSYYNIGQWKTAAQVYEQLYASIQALERNNHYNEIGICKKLAFAYQKLGDRQAALKWANSGLALPLDNWVANRRHKDLEKLREMQKQLAK